MVIRAVRSCDRERKIYDKRQLLQSLNRQHRKIDTFRFIDNSSRFLDPFVVTTFCVI